MKVTTRNSEYIVEDRAVPFIELEVLGDRHTLTVRKYPKNISVKMWKNSDKSTTVSLKMPHDKFLFATHVNQVVEQFDTEIPDETLFELMDKWEELEDSDNF